MKSNKCNVDHAIITDLAEQLCNFHPISTALGAGGALGSAFKRRRYFNVHFQCIDPVEYILDSQKNKTFQYVPILETLQEVLKNKDIADGIYIQTVLNILSQFLMADFSSKMTSMLEKKQDSL